MANLRATSQRDATTNLFRCVAPLDNVYHSPKEYPSCPASGPRQEQCAETARNNAAEAMQKAQYGSCKSNTSDAAEPTKSNCQLPAQAGHHLNYTP